MSDTSVFPPPSAKNDSTSTMPPKIPITPQIVDFHNALKNARTILAVCGAGLSASSGLPTFRGAGGFWRTYDATLLATPEAFEEKPGLVSQFYSLRRHMALRASPNPAHYTLAQLAQVHPRFKTITQNVDGLSQRAGHPNHKIDYIHGSLCSLRCENRDGCDYFEDDFSDPMHGLESLRVPIDAGANWEQNWPEAPSREEIPKCPKCGEGLKRPGVVWFGESLDRDMLGGIDEFIAKGVDLCVVVGTSGRVIPAAVFPSAVKMRGGRVAVVDVNPRDFTEYAMERKGMGVDWEFKGDAAQLLPVLFKPLIGELKISEDVAGRPTLDNDGGFF